MTIPELRATLEEYGCHWKHSWNKATLEGALHQLCDEILYAHERVGIPTQEKEQVIATIFARGRSLYNARSPNK